MQNKAIKIDDFLNTLAEPAICLSSDLSIIDMNLAAEKLTAYSKKASIGNSFSAVFPDFPNINLPNLEKCIPLIEEKELSWVCMHSQSHSNSIKYVLVGYKKILSKDPIHQEIRKLAQTLTGKKPAKNTQTLELVNDIYHYMETIISEIPVSVYWMNRDYRYLGCSNNMAKLLQLESRQDIVGKTYSDLYDKQSSAYYKKADKKVMDTGISLSLDEPLYLDDGTKKIYLSKKVPLRDSNKEIIGMLGISLDITDRKKAEEDLKAAKEAAEMASIAKTEFIANMSHDIRTPLSGVVGLGGIVEKEITDPQAQSKVHDMVKSADELLNMLNEILDVVSLSNITVNDIHEEPFDLSHLVQTIMDLEGSYVDLKKIQLFKSIDERIPRILVGDHKKIHHILLNLVSNGIKFTKVGHVRIEITLSKIEANTVHLVFAVADTGMGIQAKSLDKIFDLFYKVTPSYKGLDKGHGVGLHIVKTYAELLNGKIEVESKVNEGSTFYLYLPLKIADKNAKPQNISKKSLAQRTEEPPLLAQPEENQALIPNAPAILIIEDNNVARMITQTFVKKAECNPTVASDGESALELAKTKHFDLILSDIGLPGISGIEFAQQLRQHEIQSHKQPVPIVAITGHAEGSIHDECIAAGINEVFIKPIRPEIISELCNKFSLFPNKQALDSPNITLPQSTLGLDLPETEAELFALENQLLFDLETAKKILGESNSTILIDMLKDTINTTIPEELLRIKAAHEAGDWQVVADIAHKLKGGFVSISLNRAATACKYLERYQKTGKTALLEKLYQQLLSTLEITSNSLKAFTK